MKTITITLSDDEFVTLRRLAEQRNKESGANVDAGAANQATLTELVREAIDAAYGTSHDEVKEGSNLWKSAPSGRRPYTP